jgi:long-chain acyl-CoA synthetase
MSAAADSHTGEAMSASSERPWLASYPQGVPREINAQAYSSLTAMFEETCARFPQRPAFSSFGVSMSYAELDRLSARFAAWLAGELKLGKGDRVAILLAILLQYPVALFGALGGG